MDAPFQYTQLGHFPNIQQLVSVMVGKRNGFAFRKRTRTRPDEWVKQVVIPYEINQLKFEYQPVKHRPKFGCIIACCVITTSSRFNKEFYTYYMIEVFIFEDIIYKHMISHDLHPTSIYRDPKLIFFVSNISENPYTFNEENPILMGL